MDNMEPNAQNQVDRHINQMNNEEKGEILANFDQFKSYLSQQITKGERIGLSEEMLAKATEKVASYLAEHEEPRNREEHLLKELWEAGNKEQQHQLAHMLLNMVKQ
ncbi:DUF3243 domain-containing protein [Siminovitchia acidinfaciens]|nr:protein YmfJ [Bacillus freudenreichii]